MKILLFITKSYSLSILRPIELYCNSVSEIECAWFKTKSVKDFDVKSIILNSSKEVMNFKPDAIIVPGNIVPDFWPGLKVQIFHGLCEEKKGHYDITGFFDLYCTPGPQMTERFQELAFKHRNFIVCETGWPKLDNFSQEKNINSQKVMRGLDSSRKVILYAPTFSPKYKSSIELFESIKEIQSNKFHWFIKFHDLEKKSIVDKYRTIESDYFQIIKDIDILEYMYSSDILITDTSSVAY